MGRDIDVLTISKGLEFETFCELQEFMHKYEEQERQVFTVSRSTYISKEMANSVNPELKYRYYNLVCKFGVATRNSVASERQSSTYKMNCPAQIKFKLNKTNDRLQVHDLCLDHDYHDVSQIFYKAIPEKRRPSPKITETINEQLKMEVNTKLLKNKLRKENNLYVQNKDISNWKTKLKRNMTNGRENDLPAVIKLLENKYACETSILVDHQNNLFKGVYFSDADMRKSLLSYPDIVFVDGTYKLLSLGYTVFLFQVEDSNGRSEIVGAAIVSSEDKLTLEWMVETLKNQNLEAAKEIKCFMTDKDLTERDALKKYFPGIPIYLCLFHTLKTFKKRLNDSQMGFKDKKQREMCRVLLQNLAYSESEEDYNTEYCQLCITAPAEFMEYYNVNWHSCRTEWTVHNMKIGNLDNWTNNRVESTNKQLKDVIKKNSSLLSFVERFFAYKEAQTQETDLKCATQFIKKPVNIHINHPCEIQYQEYLTFHAYNAVKRELSSVRLISIIDCDEKLKMCKVRLKKFQISTTPEHCECSFWGCMALPCKHIFAVRERFNLNLFDESLCAKRWTKQYMKEYQRAFTAGNHNPEEKNTTSINSNHSQSLICTAPSEKAKSVQQRRKLFDIKTAEIVSLGSLATGVYLDTKLDLLDKIIAAWREGKEAAVTVIAPKTKTTDLYKKMDELTLTEVTVEENSRSFGQDSITLNDIIVPSPVVTRGKPRGHLLTTVHRQSSSSKRTPKKLDP